MIIPHGKIGRWHGAGLLATTLLGTSVFILPQMTVASANAWALWAWLLLTVTILPVALVFAKLSAKYPHAAGPAYFVEKAFGVISGRTIGMIFLCIVPLGAPAALIMTYQFVDAIFNLPQEQELWVQLGFVCFILLVNYRGIQLSAALQLSLTFAITAVVVLMLVATVSTPVVISEQLSIVQHSNMNAILAATGLAFWSFLGIEAMSHLAGDFKRPEKDLVPAIMIGTLLVGLIYMACTYMVLSVPSTTELHMVGAFDALLSPYLGDSYAWGHLIIGTLGIAGGLATVNVYTASLARLIWSFANDGVLPKPLRRKNRYGTPITALLLLLVVMSCVLAVTNTTGIDLEQLLNWVNGVFAVIYLASMLAALKLLDSRYRPVIALGCFFCGLMFWGLGISMLYAAILMLLIVPLLKWQQSRQALAI
ncbi:L-methionine/branched-chain amino acid transporter [Paraferrimonas sp. SM1919]|uniref:L-methionine/branched-chain amino acid transporter n=1 Tax=Paraferrimonas sp. SM1919 TaxID=2662263 RepID=UPI0013D48C86|nr:L-methionine/branched-chain amino acid transporter [Paraferrimonas sp. SM1919]